MRNSVLQLDSKVYFIYPYYDNPGMLERQIENWNRYKGELRRFIEIIVVDDCSQKHPAAPIMQALKGKKKLYRVMENIPWGQHHARNVGAYSIKDPNAWLFMSDMDIIFTPEEAYSLFEKRLDPNRYHTFERKFFGDVRPPKYHLNTFLVKHRHFWAVNGYDVDYCGTYGGDGQFLGQLNVMAPQLHHGNQSEFLKAGTETSGDVITLWGYEPEIVPDANTTEWTRKDGRFRRKFIDVLNQKKKSGDFRSRRPVRWPYERII